MKQIICCEPSFFDVNYVINPWMTNNLGTVDNSKAFTQWSDFITILENLGCEILLVPPEKELPDMVFTANAGLIFPDGRVMVSKFAKAERQPETKHFQEWFVNNNFKVIDYPNEFAFEGAGDALFDSNGNLWLGFGFRTDDTFANYMEENFDNVFSLRLTDPNYYHLDTCFCPLIDGYVLYNPNAFDDLSRHLIKEKFGHKAISVLEEDAKNFACNAVNIDNYVVLNLASEYLVNTLAECGFTTIQTPMTEFMKSGGSCKCLTLKIDVNG